MRWEPIQRWLWSEEMSSNPALHESPEEIELQINREYLLHHDDRVLTIVVHSSAACARRIALASTHKKWRSIHINSKLNSQTRNLNKMENCTYFFVEHDITDRQGWDKWRTSWYDIFGESMIIRNVENENCIDWFYHQLRTNAFDIPLLHNK